MKSKVYLQSGFWEGLSADTTIDGIRRQLNVLDVLCSSDTVTDATEEMITNNPFLMRIVRQGSYDRCDCGYIDKKLNSLKSDENSVDLSATYLLDKRPEECLSLEKKYGIVALSPISLSQKDYLFEGDGFSLDKRHSYDLRYMTFVEKLQQPCNSLIIIDPYLLSKRKVDETGTVSFPGIVNNLESLLNAILPQTADVDIHLTLISNLENGIKDVKTAYEKVKKCILRIRKDLKDKIKLGFFYTDKGYNHKVESFHSRHILANSFLIDAEDGFDLFNDKGYITKNNPVISIIFPRLYGNSRQDMTKYENWLQSVKKHVLEASDVSYCGSKENRLFDLVE